MASSCARMCSARRPKAATPRFFGNLLRSDYAKYGKLVKDIGFTPQ